MNKVKRKLIVIVLVLVIVGLSTYLVVNHGNPSSTETIPEELKTCPELPIGASCVIVECDGQPGQLGRTFMYSAANYTLGVARVSDVPFQYTIWIGGDDGYWVWGVASNETQDRWHRIPGLLMIGHPVVIYDQSCTPTWDAWSQNWSMWDQAYTDYIMRT